MLNFILWIASDSSDSSFFVSVYSALHFFCFRTSSPTLKKSGFQKHGSDPASSQASIGQKHWLWDWAWMSYYKNDDSFDGFICLADSHAKMKPNSSDITEISRPGRLRALVRSTNLCVWSKQGCPNRTHSNHSACKSSTTSFIPPTLH